LAEDTPRICASFTSGFDSRALHAVLRKKRADVLAYAFGAKGSINVTIPERICARMGYPFRPIHLDEQFERHFSRFAWRTIILSDGLVVQRANYPYAFEQLGRFAPVVLTGLFGSEFLRTFQNLGTVVSEHFAVVNDAGGSEAAIARVVREAKNASYLAPHVFRQAGDEVIADLGRWFRRFEHLERDHRLYMYLLTEVDRKYFAAELSTERIYATNRLPFLDDEFVEFVFSAPFAGVYARTITPTIGNRFSSQYFYAYLIRKYCPQLLPFTTDHGFPPAHLLRPLPILWVGAGYAQSRLQRRVRPNVEFRPRRWLHAFYTQEHSRLLCDVGIAGPKFAQDLQSGAYLDNLANFDKVAALHLWLGHLDGTVA
jgi:hypothetical protein